MPAEIIQFRPKPRHSALAYPVTGGSGEIIPLKRRSDDLLLKEFRNSQVSIISGMVDSATESKGLFTDYVNDTWFELKTQVVDADSFRESAYHHLKDHGVDISKIPPRLPNKPHGIKPIIFGSSKSHLIRFVADCKYDIDTNLEEIHWYVEKAHSDLHDPAEEQTMPSNVFYLKRDA